jgi:DNA recombination protein RmuC
VETVIIVFLVVLLAVVGFLVRDRREDRRNLEVQMRGHREEMVQSLNTARQVLQERIDGVDSRLNQSLTATAGTMQEIGERLGRLDQSTSQMLEVGKDISRFQDILRAPKVRGGFGEMLLANLLGQILPGENYGFQYQFRSGEKVDAIVRLGSGLVPVDSKFPMESFNRLVAAETDEERPSLRRAFLRDVRGHVDAVAKYILPDEGTFDFALMYIPAEGVYYETFFRDEKAEESGDLWAYALGKRVIPVSPNSFYAYLQAIVLGLKGMRVEERAREIIDHLGRLSNDFGRFRQEFGTLGGHIDRAKGKYDDLEKTVGRLGDRLALPLEEPRPELPSAAPSTGEED